MSRFVLIGVAFVFVALGLWALADPTGMVALVGVAPGGAGGVVELRAMYGGLELGLGAFLLGCAADRRRVAIGLLCAAATIGGLGATRLAGVLLDAPQPTVHVLFSVLELGTTGILLAAWRRA